MMHAGQDQLINQLYNEFKYRSQVKWKAFIKHLENDCQTNTLLLFSTDPLLLTHTFIGDILLTRTCSQIFDICPFSSILSLSLSPFLWGVVSCKWFGVAKAHSHSHAHTHSNTHTHTPVIYRINTFINLPTSPAESQAWTHTWAF